MTDNQWSDERLARAGLGALLQYGAMEVLELAARLGPQTAWDLLHGNEQGTAEALDERMQGRCPQGAVFTAWAASVDPAQLAQQTDRAGLRFIIPGDSEWPDCLEDLAHCDMDRLGGVPVGFWVTGPGHLAQWCQRAVALVGSRASTRYGEAVALLLASEIAKPSVGWTVVSGGAFGIDAASHRGALAAGGRTIGLFANGLDISYPPANDGLIQKIRQDGLAVSELPPGTHPTKHGFLARNRLIAALSLGTVIVEAAARSGARNTSSWAASMGRVVMGVPGPVTSALSVTPHRLIRDGVAALVASADDVIALLAPLGSSPELPRSGPSQWQDSLSGDQTVVREALPSRGGLSVNEVALASGVSVTRSIAALNHMSRLGVVTVNEQGKWRVCLPSTDSLAVGGRIEP